MQCASVTVTYSPDAAVLRAQIDALPSSWIKVIVDNCTPLEAWAPTADVLEGRSDVKLLRLDSNSGLAAAQNTGMHWLAGTTNATHVLLLDQDSEPAQGAATTLMEAFDTLASEGRPVGAVGPALMDPVSGVRHQFHVIDGWRWRRVDGLQGEVIPCAGLNGSGTFMPLALALALGGMDESLFIDLVDAEWSFRLAATGKQLYGVPGAVFIHRMGERTTRIWLLGWRTWPVRSPLRHHYLFRNAVLLLRQNHVPRVWKGWAVVKLALTAIVFSITGPHRIDQLRAMANGVLDGLHGRRGALH